MYFSALHDAFSTSWSICSLFSESFAKTSEFFKIISNISGKISEIFLRYSEIVHFSYEKGTRLKAIIPFKSAVHITFTCKDRK